MKGWVGLVGWPVADGLPTLVVTHQLQVKHRTGKKFAGQRLMFYHCATPPTKTDVTQPETEWNSIIKQRRITTTLENRHTRKQKSQI